MPVNIIFRDASPVATGQTQSKGAPLTNAEIDGNFKSVADTVNSHVADNNNPHGTTKTHIGLGNVDNTSDANKSISIATQQALNAKQPTLVSASNIKTINGASLLGAGNVAVEPSISASNTGSYWRGDKSFQTLNSAAVGLGNVDNTSDATKNDAIATLQNKTIASPNITGSASFRAIGVEGGELLLYNPDNSTVGSVFDICAADNPRWFTIRHNSQMQIGQLAGTGGTINFYSESTQKLTISNKGVGIGKIPTVPLDYRMQFRDIGSPGGVAPYTSTLYCFTNAGTLLVLPANPSAGDWVEFQNRTDALDCSIQGNGNNIMGTSSALILDIPYASGKLMFHGLHAGWILV